MSNDIIDIIKTRMINASTQNQAADRFNVRFYGIPENIGDFLSRQVRGYTPPSVSFSPMNHNNRRATFSDVGKIEVETFNMIFQSDDNGIVAGILISQLMRQKGRVMAQFAKLGKFDIEVEYLNTESEVVWTEKFTNCILLNLTRGDYETGDDSVIRFNVTVGYDSLHYSFEDENFILND